MPAEPIVSPSDHFHLQHPANNSAQTVKRTLMLHARRPFSIASPAFSFGLWLRLRGRLRQHGCDGLGRTLNFGAHLAGAVAEDVAGWVGFGLGVGVGVGFGLGESLGGGEG